MNKRSVLCIQRSQINITRIHLTHRHRTHTHTHHRNIAINKNAERRIKIFSDEVVDVDDNNNNHKDAICPARYVQCKMSNHYFTKQENNATTSKKKKMLLLSSAICTICLAFVCLRIWAFFAGNSSIQCIHEVKYRIPSALNLTNIQVFKCWNTMHLKLKWELNTIRSKRFSFYI